MSFIHVQSSQKERCCDHVDTTKVCFSLTLSTDFFISSSFTTPTLDNSCGCREQSISITKEYYPVSTGYPCKLWSKPLKYNKINRYKNSYLFSIQNCELKPVFLFPVEAHICWRVNMQLCHCSYGPQMRGLMTERELRTHFFFNEWKHAIR